MKKHSFDKLGRGGLTLYAFSLDWLMMTDIFSGTKVIAMWKMCVKALNVKTEAAFSLPIFSTVRSEASLYGIPYHRFDSQRGLLYTTSNINTYKIKRTASRRPLTSRSQIGWDRQRSGSGPLAPVQKQSAWGHGELFIWHPAEFAD